MSLRLAAGPPATADDLRAAQERDRLLGTELPRVRAAATAWRNGLAGLLATLAGFSLIKGQSDISHLSTGWAAAVGIAVLGAFLAGAVGALMLIRAVTGRPAVVRVSGLLSRTAANHEEALAAASALRTGLVLTVACASFLVAAVGIAWYGPGRAPLGVQVTTPTGVECGWALQLSRGTLTIDSTAGIMTSGPGEPAAIRPVEQCPG